VVEYRFLIEKPKAAGKPAPIPGIPSATILERQMWLKSHHKKNDIHHDERAFSMAFS
jgi:hypothetical protein